MVAGCLRNATAVGRWLARHDYGTAQRPVVVIAAGERWPDGSLRPALEDLLGAGAIIDALESRGVGPLSPEAAAARGCFVQTADVVSAVAAGSSGRELTRSGFADDVAIATELDAGATVPVLTDGAFDDSTDETGPLPNQWHRPSRLPGDVT
ncbi:2-phosphosulfolactate phosphatase [Streptomyces roseicoloratus]|uniref:Probable 2-phosphosulfolactate phosphatase n=1 Tax=Streptomyces roseicoloratus TaxID=2508722 RepID=A0ABY9S2R0_9ACTN|nr:2-phosphosulfolactate phosphatase [Streptomyces roseicoloratus]WMX48696.1 2-phosphosulfolactate phosphatase [Streptomyces roseicoloratus]